MFNNSDIEKKWLSDLEGFISHWEQETEMIKHRVLNPDECWEISRSFQENCQSLLVRKPVGMHDDVLSKIERLDDKLNTSLAMVCTYKK